jgi:hypothetical protein
MLSNREFEQPISTGSSVSLDTGGLALQYGSRRNSILVFVHYGYWGGDRSFSRVEEIDAWDR